ncbi:hypothetical protein JCM8097_004239 [Rhodosporidiobolus ruineniae]
MLDRLPLELVQHIVFLALPPFPSFGRSRQRYTTLLAIALTCKALRDIAHPLQYEVVDLRSEEAVESFLSVLEGNTALGKRVRALRFEGDWREVGWDASPSPDLRPFAVTCPNVVEVMFCRLLAKMRRFEVFPHLERLTLSGGHLSAFDTFCLPALRELSFVDTSFQAHGFDGSEALVPSAFPRLESLYHQCTDDDIFDLGRLEAFRSCSVALSSDNPDLIFFDGAMPNPLQHVLQSHVLYASSNGCFEGNDGTTTDHLRALRLNPLAYLSGIDSLPDEAMVAKVEARLTEFVTRLSRQVEDSEIFPRLSSVYLPDTYCDIPLPMMRGATKSDATLRLEGLCASRNIELIFEDLPHPYYDSFISPEFVKRCKAAKAKEAAKALRAAGKAQE